MRAFFFRSLNYTPILFRRSVVDQTITVLGEAGIKPILFEQAVIPPNQYISYNPLTGEFIFNYTFEDIQVSFDASIGRDGAAQTSVLLGGVFFKQAGASEYTQLANTMPTKTDSQNILTPLLTLAIYDVKAGARLKYLTGAPTDTVLGVKLTSIPRTGLTTTFTQPAPSASIIIQARV